MAHRRAGETVSTSGRLSGAIPAVDRGCHLVASMNADVARSDVPVERSMSSIAVVKLNVVPVVSRDVRIVAIGVGTCASAGLLLVVGAVNVLS